MKSVLRVASYNVHSCVGLDRRFSPERIAEVISALDADIVAVQELGWHHRGRRGFDQFAYIESVTGYHVIQGPTKYHARAHYGNALLLRERPGRHRLIDLSWPLHIPRGCILAQTRFAGEPLTIMNVHLGLMPWDRRRQVRHLLYELDRIDGDVILVGDFNSWRPAGAAFGAVAARLPRVSTVPSFPVRAPSIPLDRIYLSPRLTFMNVDVLHTPLTVKASDHLPVVAEIRHI